MLLLSNLQSRVSRLSTINPPLTEVRETGQSPSLAPLSWSQQLYRSEMGPVDRTEGDPAPRALQVILPSGQGEER